MEKPPKNGEDKVELVPPLGKAAKRVTRRGVLAMFVGAGAAATLGRYQAAGEADAVRGILENALGIEEQVTALTQELEVIRSNLQRYEAAGGQGLVAKLENFSSMFGEGIDQYGMRVDQAIWNKSKPFLTLRETLLNQQLDLITAVKGRKDYVFNEIERGYITYGMITTFFSVSSLVFATLSLIHERAKMKQAENAINDGTSRIVGLESDMVNLQQAVRDMATLLVRHTQPGGPEMTPDSARALVDKIFALARTGELVNKQHNERIPNSQQPPTT